MPAMPMLNNSHNNPSQSLAKGGYGGWDTNNFFGANGFWGSEGFWGNGSSSFWGGW
jgi:hypothetical protein